MGKVIRYVLYGLLIACMTVVIVASVIMSGIFHCRYPVPMVWQMTILYAAIGIVLPAAVIAICIVGLVRKCGTTFIVITWLTVLFLSFVAYCVLFFAFMGTFVSKTELPENFGKWDKSVEATLQRQGIDDLLAVCSANAEIRKYLYYHEPEFGHGGRYYQIEACFVYRNAEDYKNALEALQAYATDSEGNTIYTVNYGSSELVCVTDPDRNALTVLFYSGYQYDLQEATERLNKTAEAAA